MLRQFHLLYTTPTIALLRGLHSSPNSRRRNLSLKAKKCSPTSTHSMHATGSHTNFEHGRSILSNPYISTHHPFAKLLLQVSRPQIRYFTVGFEVRQWMNAASQTPLAFSLSTPLSDIKLNHISADSPSKIKSSLIH
jgi:hypothetical protein